MSWRAAPDPIAIEEPGEPAIELELEARTRSIGAFDVGRVLPAPARRMVGPFVFLDQIGPAALAPGAGLDVRPHPHIGLATVTYLFEGTIVHRDSLCSEQSIQPGAINWMIAGRGIAHSERSPADERARGPRVHGLQIWVALPDALEESEPGFSHHSASTLPELEDGGVRARVLAGAAYGATAPVPIGSPLYYVEATLEPGARLEVPRDHEERAVYVVLGAVRIGEATVPAGRMAVLAPRGSVVIEARERSRVVLIGGAPVGPRHVWWNFVSSRTERIEEAARDWKAGRFPKVPGDELEFIPLTEEPRFPRGAG